MGCVSLEQQGKIKNVQDTEEDFAYGFTWNVDVNDRIKFNDDWVICQSFAIQFLTFIKNVLLNYIFF